MRRLTVVLCLLCGWLSACSVDRVPIVTSELTSDGGDSDAWFHDPDAHVPQTDAAADAALQADATELDAAVTEPDASQADAAIEVDAGTDSAVDVDAHVAPPQRFEGSCALGCDADETCVRSTALLSKRSYCAQHCNDDRDCGPGPIGADSPRCSSQGLCRLPCDAVLGAGCPSDMMCLDALLIVPGGDGTCAFVE